MKSILYDDYQGKQINLSKTLFVSQDTKLIFEGVGSCILSQCTLFSCQSISTENCVFHYISTFQLCTLGTYAEWYSDSFMFNFTQLNLYSLFFLYKNNDTESNLIISDIIIQILFKLLWRNLWINNRGCLMISEQQIALCSFITSS